MAAATNPYVVGPGAKWQRPEWPVQLCMST